MMEYVDFFSLASLSLREGGEFDETLSDPVCEHSDDRPDFA